mmetsp:Transcript_65906/g.157579  ORF Transcript_65906/g.157579 Transcript_65906/m.157579 type:complete len:294 (+) Transcript_65906:109-990(+)
MDAYRSILCDPRLARYAWHNSWNATNSCLLMEASLKGCAQYRLMQKLLPDSQSTICMHCCHHCASACPTGRAVNNPSPSLGSLPIKLHSCHHHRVLAMRCRADCCWTTKAHDVRSWVIELRVLHTVLLSCCNLDHLPCPAQFFGMTGMNLQIDCSSIHYRIPHPAKSDLHRHSPQSWHLNHDGFTTIRCKRRLIAQGNSGCLASAALRDNLHEPYWCLQEEFGHGLLHGHSAGFEQCCRHTNAIVPRHSRVDEPLLHNHETERSLWKSGWQDDVGTLGRVAARLLNQQLPQTI